MFLCHFNRSLILILTLIASVGQAATIKITNSAVNHTRQSALNLDEGFSNGRNPNATNPWDYEATRYFHVTADTLRTSSAGRDWYQFTVFGKNTKTFLDIDATDGSWRSWLGLYNASGKLLAFNDTGEVFDTGSSYPWDSFIFTTLKPGTYYAAVARDYNLPLMQEHTYKLNIGVGEQRLLTQGGNVTQTPLPAGIWLFGSAFAGLMFKLPRKTAAKTTAIA
jgi:hypothetical protein